MKDINYIVDILEEIVNIPSPSGYTKQVMERIEKEVAGFGFSSAYNRKGGMLITVPGRTETVLGLSAHVDTLGAMVRSIRPDGTLAIVSVGGFMMQSVEGSYCRIHTREGKTFTGCLREKTTCRTIFSHSKPRSRAISGSIHRRFTAHTLPS